MPSSSPSTPQGSDARFRDAIRHQDAGDRRAAIAAIEALCRDDPTYASGWAHLSYLWIAEGDRARALAAAQEALRYKPDMLVALINAGIAAYKLGDLETARRSLEHAVRLDPADPHSQLYLGRTLAAIGDRAGAIDAYVRALGERAREERDPDWITREAAASFATIEPAQPIDSLLGSLHEGVRWLAGGKLVRSYRCLERARDGPCGLELDVSATRAAAKTLLGEVWRRRARMAPTPNDAERPCAPPIHLRP